ncbi:MAG: trigger factor [Coriobacteriales bacterium]
MKVREKKLAGGKLRLEARASAKEVESAFNSAHIAFAQSAGLEPQPGKTVAQVAQEKLGIRDLDNMVQEQVAQTLMHMAVDKSCLQPAYPPAVTKILAAQRGRELDFEVELMPKEPCELRSYDPVKIAVAPYSFDESLVEQQMQELADSIPHYESTGENRAVRAGDSVLIELDCTDKDTGLKIGGLCFPSLTYVAGKGTMPQGFEDAVIGMMPGEKKEFEFEGPDVDEADNERVQRVQARVRILQLQEERKASVTDEWVAIHMPMFKNAGELRADMRRSLEQYSRDQYDAQCRQLCASKAAQRFEGHIPDEAYEHMRAQLLAELDRQLAQQKMTREEYMKQMGGEQQFSMMLIVQSREALAQGYALDAVFAHEGLKLDDEDYTLAAREINPQVNPQQLRKQLEASGRGYMLREAAQRRKAAQWLLDHAKISYS